MVEELHSTLGKIEICNKCSTRFLSGSTKFRGFGVHLCNACFELTKSDETVLEEAARLVGGDRRKEYGHPKDNFKDVAAMWNVILEPQQKITVSQIALCMIAWKLCRAKGGYKRDTGVDLAGYAYTLDLVNEEVE